MASTLSNLLYHIVFHTKGNQPILKNCKEELYKYITGIVKGEGGKLIIINGTNDHIHMAIRLLPRHCISEILKKIKGNSSKWINNSQKAGIHFAWQAGYGVFSVSKSQLETLIHYIQNQEQHHKKRTFREEYLELLKKHNIEYDERYLWT